MKNRLMIKDRSASSSSSLSSSSSQQPPHHLPHGTRKPKMALLREVFGRGVCLGWRPARLIAKTLSDSSLSPSFLFFPPVQGQCSAGCSHSIPALHRSGESSTLPCPTTTSDLCEHGAILVWRNGRCLKLIARLLTEKLHIEGMIEYFVCVCIQVMNERMNEWLMHWVLMILTLGRKKSTSAPDLWDTFC